MPLRLNCTVCALAQHKIVPADEAAVGEGFDAVSLTAIGANSLRQSPNEGEAESEAVSPNSCPMDAELAAVVEAWPTLPDAIKAGILAMIRAAK